MRCLTHRACLKKPLWRGDLSPMDCAAVPCFQSQNKSPPEHPVTGKSPHHKMFCPTHRACPPEAPLWRGDLSPMDCAAVPCLQSQNKPPPEHPVTGKSHHHKMFCPTHRACPPEAPLWRGDSSPMDCAAVPCLQSQNKPPPEHPVTGKSPHHKMFCPTHRAMMYKALFRQQAGALNPTARTRVFHQRLTSGKPQIP
jgi:hypothetical protein